MDRKKRLSRFLAVVLAAALMFAPVVPAHAATVGDFNDVGSSDWFYNAVDFVVSRGLFTGSSSTMFNPNGRMTRGMFITVLGRYAGVNASAWLSGTVTGSDVNLRSGPGTDNSVVGVLSRNTDATIQGKSGNWYKISTSAGTGYVSADYFQPDHHYFSDVDYGQYYAGYAVWAFEKGIVNGNGSADKFTPDSNITREQLCAMLSRFASVMGTSLSQTESAVTFPDGGSISSWAADSVSAMQRSGIVKGDAQGNFRPRGSATRAETATMLQRFESACGGFSAPSQDPPPKAVQPESDGGGTATPPSSGGTTTPPSEVLPDPSDVPDTPASLIGGSVGIKSSVIRVGVLVKTGSFDTSVSSVSLYNIGGYGFEFGSMYDRQFSSNGSSTGDNTINIVSDGSTFTVTDSGGGTVYTGGEPLAIHPLSGGKALTQVNGEYKYYGNFELRQASGSYGNISVINYVDIEDYVKGVLPFEFSNSWPAEALKAAAVACRSYVMSYNWGIYDGYGMDVPTGSGTQIYRGRGITYDESYYTYSDAAVEATSGQYLTYGGSICVTSYSSCNGGTIRSSAEVFGTNYAYLVNKADPYESAAAGEVYGGYDQAVANSHKVGMSAWGCYAMAQYYSKSYESILGFYYPGTNLQYGA